MSKFFFGVTAMAVAFTFAAVETADAREGRFRARGQNGVVAGAAGPNGGGFLRGAGCGANDAGGTNCASGGVARGPEGGLAGRASTTTFNADGSAARQGGFAAQGPDGGSAISQGSATRNADGTYSGSRSTDLVASDGSTYQGDVTYDSATGVTRTTTCTDPTGAVVACPR